MMMQHPSNSSGSRPGCSHKAMTSMQDSRQNWWERWDKLTEVKQHRSSFACVLLPSNGWNENCSTAFHRLLTGHSSLSWLLPQEGWTLNPDSAIHSKQPCMERKHLENYGVAIIKLILCYYSLLNNVALCFKHQSFLTFPFLHMKLRKIK